MACLGSAGRTSTFLFARLGSVTHNISKWNRIGELLLNTYHSQLCGLFEPISKCHPRGPPDANEVRKHLVKRSAQKKKFQAEPGLTTQESLILLRTSPVGLHLAAEQAKAKSARLASVPISDNLGGQHCPKLVTGFTCVMGCPKRGVDLHCGC